MPLSDWTGEPPSTITSPALPNQSIQACIPACCCSGVALAICSAALASVR